MKKLLVLTFLVAIVAFAQYTDTDFHQYTKGDFSSYHTYQSWDPDTERFTGWTESDMITLKVKGGTTVYLSNYVKDWYGGDIPDLGDPDYALGYDMSAKKYGYQFAEIVDGKATPVGDIIWADGTTATITYTNPKYNQWNGLSETLDITGYKLGTFKDDAEIFLVLTPNGYDTTLTSYDPVAEYDAVANPNGLKSIFKSRHVDPEDLAANARVNFAFGTLEAGQTGSSHEFVIGSVATTTPVGSPLPGVCLSGLIFLGTATAARLRKRSRK
ncbi:MAG: hypothetical protein J6X49_13330 [Victivallales bacterium]|nr:hypothetical protein [Victivallales bacterium]